MPVSTSLAIVLVLALSFLPESLFSSPSPPPCLSTDVILFPILFLRRFKMLCLSDVMPDPQHQCRPTRFVLLFFLVSTDPQDHDYSNGLAISPASCMYACGRGKEEWRLLVSALTRLHGVTCPSSSLLSWK